MHTSWYATPHLGPSADGSRANPGRSWLALSRCLYAPALPDPAGERAWRASPGDGAPPGLRPPDGARGDPGVQRARRGRLAARLAPADDHSCCLRRGQCRTAASAAAPESTHVREADEPVDARSRRRGQLRARPDLGADQRRDEPLDAQAAGDRLEAGQTLDHKSRSRVRTKKSSRDRLIRLVAGHQTWVLGFQDEGWWSRLALPALHSWAEPDQPLRLVEQAVAKD